MLNIIGERYGRLIVLEEIERINHKERRYRCQCDCGNIKDINQSVIRNGSTKSCGCLEIEARHWKKPNEIIIYADYAEIILTNLKWEEIARAVIDINDIDLIKKYRWHLSKSGYASANSYDNINVKIYMHRLIHPTGEQADHIDRNKLNNRRSNLRDATNAQNVKNSKIKSTNTSGIAGVTMTTATGRWRAVLRNNGIMHHLGYYDNKEEAARVRREAELKYFGEFAVAK